MRKGREIEQIFDESQAAQAELTLSFGLGGSKRTLDPAVLGSIVKPRSVKSFRVFISKNLCETHEQTYLDELLPFHTALASCLILGSPQELMGGIRTRL
jgi:hypothetical protein